MKPVLLLLLILLTGCASYGPVSWAADFGALDGSTIQISGRPIFSELGESLLWLCPAAHSDDPSGKCLDIIAPTALVNKLRRSSAQCIVVSGEFSAFGPERIGMGNHRSDLGYIEAAHAAPCHGR